MMDGIEGTTNLAAASGEDLSTTSDIVMDALTDADSSHFADVLAAASSNANTNVSMMGETFKYAAPIAGALGFSAEDTAETIGLMFLGCLDTVRLPGSEETGKSSTSASHRTAPAIY